MNNIHFLNRKNVLLLLSTDKNQVLNTLYGNFKKYKVYFNEFNVMMGNVAYFPLVSGRLRAYAETFDEIRTHFEFMPFIFARDKIEHIMSYYNNPSITVFSVYMWNEQLCLKVAETLKKKYQDCLIIFGGPQVPRDAYNYFRNFPFIDISVRGEGEQVFVEILKCLMSSNSFADIPGITWRDTVAGDIKRNNNEQILPTNLDLFPSPYLSGLFEDLISKNPDLEFQAIIETNRGCPFSCAYCFWGQDSLSKKYRFFSLERVFAEVEWFASHRIKYVFNADSNFGLHKRDIEIAHRLVDVKKKYGYPEKFRSCYTKNAENRIYDIAMLLCKQEIDKGITMSFQSVNEEVLKNIRRQNIKLAVYKNLQAKFNRENIPVYTELILGLPGETYNSWAEGINSILESEFTGQLFIYLCEIYPNTDLANPVTQKKFGIVTKKILLTETHGVIRSEGLIPEYQDIIVATKSMPTDEWQKALIFSWMCMTLYSLKLGFFIMKYLFYRYGIRYKDFIEFLCNHPIPATETNILSGEISEYKKHISHIFKGGGRSCELPKFGTIYWDMEETSFLRISDGIEDFYKEMFKIVKAILEMKGFSVNDEELNEIIRYQQLRIPIVHKPKISKYKFSFNIPAYFDSISHSHLVQLCKQPQVVTLHYNDFQGDKMKYAREVILWGRKSNKILVPVEWQNEI